MLPKICAFPECGRPSRAANFCTGHYQQQKTGRALRPLGGHALTAGMSPAERFWSRVNTSGEHWLWTGASNEHGYGHLQIAGQWKKAHRYAWELTNGPISAGLEIDHMCHTPACVRPDHLQLVDRKRNNENMSGPRIDSRSGIRGVGWDSRRGRYYVRVTHHSRAHWGGYFYDISEAETAAIALRNELFTNNLTDRNAA